MMTGCALSNGTLQRIDRVADRVDQACDYVRPAAKIASLIPGIPASIAAYVILGCDTAEGIQRLREDPTTVEWLAKIKDELTAAGISVH
jgi:hypothetical protein